MKKNELSVISKQFAIDIISLCEEIRSEKRHILVNQLLRSGTSIGANIFEAYYASSRADFVNKLQIALKECYETEYWLDIFRESHIITAVRCEPLLCACKKIRKLLVASVRTTKNNM